ncbi:MAG: SCO family protein [Bdellovibrio sp.]|nr:SCO family protein [Bdellovibrio sp.]
MKKHILLSSLFAALLALAVLSGVIWYSNRQPELGGTFSANYNGQDWNFKDDARKMNLLYIGYAKCPDVCPMALSYTNQAINLLSDNERKNVRVIFLSVDVEHDTPAAVATYAQQFNPEFIGISGSRVIVDTIVNLFKASYVEEKDAKSYLGYSISHTDRIYFLNKKGIVLDTLPNPRSAESIVQKIRENL